MSDQPENIILHRLDVIDRRNNRILESVAGLTDESRALKIRTTAVVEAAIGTDRRLDRSNDRLEQIERRLELAEVTE